MNKMLKNSIISIVFCITLFCKISSALKCYDCGYLIDADGKIGPLVEGEEAVNFCTGNYPENWQTKDAGEGNCCASYKGIIKKQSSTNPEGNLKLGPLPHTIIRHGTNTDSDE